MNCFTRKALVGTNRVRIHLNTRKTNRFTRKTVRFTRKPFVLRVKQKYYYI